MSVGGTAPLPPASLVQPGGKARILFKVKLIASNGKLFQSWVTVQMKEFLYWFVWAKGILNLFPEIFDLNPEGDKKGEEDQAESTQYRR